MKFIVEPKHGIVQASRIVIADGKHLCTFTDGVFETDDEEVAEKLRELGYLEEGQETSEQEQEQQQEEEEELVDISKLNDEEEEKAIRDKAKELGISSYHLKKIETLKKEIAEKEVHNLV